MFKDVPIKTFKLADLVNRKVSINSYRNKHIELIIAKDLVSGELFVLKEIKHSICEEQAE